MSEVKIKECLSEIECHAASWEAAIISEIKRADPATEIVWQAVWDNFKLASNPGAQDQERLEKFTKVAPMLHASLILAGALSEPAGIDHDDQKYWEHELRALKQVQASLERINHVVKLEDWRSAGNNFDPGLLATPIEVNIETTSDKILINTSDGREIMIELQADDLRVMAYNVEYESPAILNIPTSSEVRVDMDDYRNEVAARRSDYEP